MKLWEVLRDSEVMKIRLVMDCVHDDGEVYRDTYVFDGEVSHLVEVSSSAFRVRAGDFGSFPECESVLLESSPIACDEVGSWVLVSLDIVGGE